MSEKTAEQHASAGSQEKRRAFLTRSAGAVALGLALSALFDDTPVAEAQEGQPEEGGANPRPPIETKAGRYTITEKQAARVNGIRRVLYNAIIKGDVRASIAQHGKGLSAADRSALSKLTREELLVLRGIRGKLKVIGDSGFGLALGALIAMSAAKRVESRPARELAIMGFDLDTGNYPVFSLSLGETLGQQSSDDE